MQQILFEENFDMNSKIIITELLRFVCCGVLTCGIVFYMVVLATMI